MVKFAKELALARHVPWSNHYLNYKQLKKLLKKAVAVDTSLTERDEFKNKFRQYLKAEIEKVVLFFLKKQGEVASRLLNLRETHAMVLCEQSVKDTTASECMMKIERMTKSYREVGDELCLLIQFVSLNVTAVRKILKKHDKNVQEAPLTQSFWAVGVTHEREFSRLPQLYHYEGIAAIVTTIKEALGELKYMEMGISELVIQDENGAPQTCSTLISFEQGQCVELIDDPTLTIIEFYRRRLRQSNEFVQTMATASGLMLGLDDMDSEGGFKMHTRKVCKVSNFLNLMSTFLYMTNYYIVAPSSAEYLAKVGGDPALAGLIIGMTPIATLFTTVLYSWWANYSYKSAILFASACSLLGNICYSLALPYNSLNMMIIGRLLNGFGGARAVNRRYIADVYSKEDRTAASAEFVTAGALGMSAGPFMAALFGYIHTSNSNMIWTEETAPGWVMCVLWTFYMVAAFVYFKEPDRISETPATISTKKSNDEILPLVLVSDDAPSNFECYGTLTSNGTKSKQSENVVKSPSLLTNIPVMTTLILYFLLKLVLESLFSSEPAITKFYFGWSTTMAGTYLAVLGILMFPANLCLARLSYKYHDKDIIYTITISMFVGIVGLISYSSIVAYSTTQYIFFSICIFISTNVLEGACMSLLSKTIPASYAKGVFNSGFLATQCGTLGRAIGDVFISYVGVYGINHLLNGTFITLAFITFLTTVALHIVYPYLRLKKDDGMNDSSHSSKSLE